MTPVREKEIFVAALDKSEGRERDDFVANECGDDQQLRLRVDSLLRAADGRDDFLEAESGPVFQPADSILPTNGAPIQIGDYELTEIIDRGAMGVVYRANQLSLNRTVALKMIRGTVLRTETDAVRFQQEAEAAAGLAHPNIVPIYEVGELHDQPFFTMKLVDGGNLADRMEETREDLTAAVEMLAKVARAVHAAHQAGVIHRDIKPSNILLDDSGEPHLTDFGLSKISGSENAFTLSGQIVGTPSYMAPEQAVKGETVSTLADVYSLGAILYQLLTGKPPVAGDSIIEMIGQLKDADPVAPSKNRPDVDPDLETIAMRCLDRAPEKRYDSARLLAEELERWLAGEPILARPLRKREHLTRWARRNPKLAMATFASTLLLLVILIGSPIVAIQQTRAKREIAEGREIVRHQLYGAEMRLASQLSERPGGGAQIQQYLEKWESTDLCGWEWNYLNSLTNKHVFSTAIRSSDWSAPVWIGDDEIVVRLTRSRTSERWNWRTGGVKGFWRFSDIRL
ncbi:MAG: serine/threonine-protein kinase [Verrucomicrobiota bacterium]